MSADHVHDAEALPPPTMEEVIDRRLRLRPARRHVVDQQLRLHRRPDGVVAIDTCATERRTGVPRGAAVTPQPVRVLVNTHHHGDHTHGNYLHPPGDDRRPHRCAARRSSQTGISHYEGVLAGATGATSARPADRSPSTTTSTSGPATSKVELHYIGRRRTRPTTSSPGCPSAVLFAGDLVFNGGTPFVLMGSVAGLAGGLERIRRLRARRDRPRPRPGVRPGVLDVLERYHRFVLDLAARSTTPASARWTPPGTPTSASSPS